MPGAQGLDLLGGQANAPGLSQVHPFIDGGILALDIIVGLGDGRGVGVGGQGVLDERPLAGHVLQLLELRLLGDGAGHQYPADAILLGQIDQADRLLG